MGIHTKLNLGILGFALAALGMVRVSMSSFLVSCGVVIVGAGDIEWPWLNCCLALDESYGSRSSWD